MASRISRREWVRGLPSASGVGKYDRKQAHSASERSVGYGFLIRESVRNHPNPQPYQTGSKVHEEDGEAAGVSFPLLDGCGAGKQDHEVRLLDPGDVDLAPVHHVMVALARRCCANGSRVGSSFWLGDGEGLQPQITPPIFGRYCRFCSSDPCLRSVPMVYIWAWAGPALAPLR